MNVLFTICGRAGSKGIKNKNVRMFCGQFLVYYTISAIDLYIKKHPDNKYNIVVNTDSEELIDIVSSNLLRHVDVIRRNPSLAGDAVGKIEVIRDCKIKMEEEKSTIFDIIVDLDITSPLRTVKNIEDVISLHNERRPDVTTTVTTARRNPYFNQVKRTSHGVRKIIDSNYTARQQTPEVFDMNASIYAYAPKFLETNAGILEGYCEIVEMLDTGILDLDHEHDFELMEVIAEYLFNHFEDFSEIKNNIP